MQNSVNLQTRAGRKRKGTRDHPFSFVSRAKRGKGEKTRQRTELHSAAQLRREFRALVLGHRAGDLLTSLAPRDQQLRRFHDDARGSLLAFGEGRGDGVHHG